MVKKPDQLVLSRDCQSGSHILKKRYRANGKALEKTSPAAWITHKQAIKMATRSKPCPR
jgi:hypothetical protein